MSYTCQQDSKPGKNQHWHSPTSMLWSWTAMRSFSLMDLCCVSVSWWDRDTFSSFRCSSRPAWVICPTFKERPVRKKPAWHQRSKADQFIPSHQGESLCPRQLPAVPFFTLNLQDSPTAHHKSSHLKLRPSGFCVSKRRRLATQKSDHHTQSMHFG
jgi:hypothetical protein